MKIEGNIEGIKKNILVRLNALLGTKYPHNLILSPDLAGELASISAAIKREVALYLDRHGVVNSIMIGDRHTVPLPVDMRRRSSFSLSGLRCVHTHPNSGSELSSLDITSMLEGNMDAMIAIGLQEDTIISIHIALPANNGQYQTLGPLNMAAVASISFPELITEIEKELTKPAAHIVEEAVKTALLIGFKEKKDDLLTGEESLTELTELAVTAGIKVHACLLINNTKADPSLYLGKGKIKELSLYRQQEAIDLIILDDFLSPRQQRNLEEELGCGVTDRTALILQIFAQRARTKEGKLQVELAQLNYLLPRLIGFGQNLSRLGGGIGTRGPGETKLETDRRRIRVRISELQQEIEQIKKRRNVLRKQRHANEIPVVALVGYTNAGKSTLMNTLTQADVLTENKLFATLDPTTRHLKYKQQDMLLTDTVGFIHKLPHQLISAFRATLEEINYADLLLHIIDASHPAFEAHMLSVRQVLDSIGAGEKISILVFNKWDVIKDPIEFQDIIKKSSPSLAISAINGTNIDSLLEMVLEYLPQKHKTVKLIIPYAHASITNNLYKNGQVTNIEYLHDHILCTACVPISMLNALEPFFDRKERP